MQRRCRMATAFVPPLPFRLPLVAGGSSRPQRATCMKRPRVVMAKEDAEKPDEVRLEDVEGHVENAQVQPKLDIDIDETILMIKLRRMLSDEDFKRIFNARDRRIGEL